jgi:hypothetical protein
VEHVLALNDEDVSSMSVFDTIVPSEGASALEPGKLESLPSRALPIDVNNLAHITNQHIRCDVMQRSSTESAR